MNFNEQNPQPYDWDNEGVYVIQNDDYVEGGEDGTSNRQAKELTKRTRNLHKRMTTAEGEIDVLQDEIPVKVEAALRTAKQYTDGKDTVLRADMAIADTTTLQTAKSYADTIVAALVDNSPEALNTLQELAVAMGNDPNFATTVMQAIGERAKTTDVNAALAGKANATDVNAALAGKANTSHGHNYLPATGGTVTGGLKVDRGIGLVANFSVDNSGAYVGLDKNGASKGLFYVGESALQYVDNAGVRRDVYHTGNLNPLSIDETMGYHNLDRGNGVWFDYDFASTGLAGSVISGGVSGGYQTQLFGVYGGNRFFLRTHHGDLGRYNAACELYHTGNLGPATTAANGLMSAGDKTRVDDMRRVILSGRVDAAGNKVMGKGVWNVTRADEGIYHVTYNIPHDNYIPIVSGMNGMWACATGFTSRTLGVKTGDDASPNDGAFSFVILEL